MFHSFLSDVKSLASELATTAADAANELSIAASEAATEIKLATSTITNQLELQYGKLIHSTNNNNSTLWYIWQTDKLDQVDTLKNKIQALANDHSSFNALTNTNTIPIDYNKYHSLISNTLSNDHNLAEQYRLYVPNILTQKQFWCNYFQHVEQLRSSLGIEYIINKPIIQMAVATPITTGESVTLPIDVPTHPDIQTKSDTAHISDPFETATSIACADASTVVPFETNQLNTVNTNTNTPATAAPSKHEDESNVSATTLTQTSNTNQINSSSPVVNMVDNDDVDLADLERQLSELSDNDVDNQDLDGLELDEEDLK